MILTSIIGALVVIAAIWFAWRTITGNSSKEDVFKNIKNNTQVNLEGDNYGKIPAGMFSPEGLIALYMQNVSSHVARHIFNISSSLHKSIELVGAKFHRIEILGKDEDETRGVIFIKAINIFEKEYISYIGFWYDWVPPSKVTSTKMSLKTGSPYIINGKIAVISRAAIVYPDPKITPSGFKPDNLKEALEGAKIDYLYKDVEKSRLYRLQKTASFYRLEGSKIKETWHLTEKELECNYPNITVHYKSQDVQLKIDKAWFLLVQQLLAGRSIGIGGHIGTGKTWLMKALISHVSQAEDIRLIETTTSTLEDMMKPDFQWSVFQNYGPTPVKNILIIDQAEGAIKKLPSEFLALTDGLVNEQYNLSFLFTFNGELNEFPEALFRNGRVININLKPHTKEQAKRKALQLVEAGNSGMVFDHEAFLKEANKQDFMALGTIYEFYNSLNIDKLEATLEGLRQSTPKSVSSKQSTESTINAGNVILIANKAAEELAAPTGSKSKRNRNRNRNSNKNKKNRQ